jgi:hypothetical protein
MAPEHVAHSEAKPFIARALMRKNYETVAYVILDIKSYAPVNTFVTFVKLQTFLRLFNTMLEIMCRIG